MLAGEPVFQPQDEPMHPSNNTDPVASQPEDSQSTDTSPFQDESGRKIIPRVEFDDLNVDLSSDSSDMEVWGTIKNESELQVELDKFTWLGRTIDLATFLRPGEARQVKLYSGDTPKSDAYSSAELTYKLDNGDYFQQQYYLEYDFQNSAYYVPEQLHIKTPPRDL